VADNTHDLLTVKEAADLLRLNATYLTNRLATGEFPVEVAFRVGRTWRLHRGRLLEWFQGKTREHFEKRSAEVASGNSAASSRKRPAGHDSARRTR
jgi:excisionase family DNA binding protein